MELAQRMRMPDRQARSWLESGVAAGLLYYRRDDRFALDVTRSSREFRVADGAVNYSRNLKRGDSSLGTFDLQWFAWVEPWSEIKPLVRFAAEHRWKVKVEGFRSTDSRWYYSARIA